ncbi:MAG: IS66 family transposase [Bacteroidales bacterium]|nr:IS66 family transposase [Bacteroidales bacterium]
MTHARRKFEAALDNDKVRAGYVFTKIQALYSTERKAREAGYFL